MVTTWQWAGLALLVFLVGCGPTSQVGESPPQSSDDVAVETTNLVDDSVSTDTRLDPEASTDTMAGPGTSSGTKAPHFVLKNQAGEDVALSDLLKEHNVAIVFYRSADW